MDNFCQSPVTTSTQGENAKVIFTSERQNILDVLTETLKVLTIDSTINNSACYNSDEDDAESNPERDPLVANHASDRNKRKVTDTDTTNGNSKQKLLISRTLQMIIPPIGPWIADGVTAVRENMHAHQTIASKVIVTAVPHSSARIFQNTADVSHTDTDRMIPQDGNTFINSPG